MWYPIEASTGPVYPVIPWTPAVELRVKHSRFDAPSFHPTRPGVFHNRHVVTGKELPLPCATAARVSIEEDPATGHTLALESGPRDPETGLGGELGELAGRTRLEMEWQFLQMHLEEAITRYRARQPLLNHNDWVKRQTAELSTWDVCAAIAEYAVNWKNRMAGGPFVSVHPVDVLCHSHHCAGAANISMVLAQVAGIAARRISISSHSMVEFLIDGRWCWSDNIRGGVLLHPGSYQEFIGGLMKWPHCSPSQKRAYSLDEVHYRAPYDYSESLWWRFGNRIELPGVSASGDCAQGIGYSVHYDPATAAALYPEESLHVFHADADAEPWLTLGAKGGWLHVPKSLGGRLRVRRRFYLSDCGDNPVQAGELRVWCLEGDGEGLELTFDGQTLALRGCEVQRYMHQAAVFEVPPELLTPGWHDVIVSGKGTVMLFPDLVSPSEGSADQESVTIDAQQVLTDPVHRPAALDL